MPWYVWDNVRTQKQAEVYRPAEQADHPPDDSGNWKRVYSFGVGRVEGGGSSPARPSVIKAKEGTT